MAAPSWAEELASIVRLHSMKGTLTQGWETMHGRLLEPGLASEHRVLGEFIRCCVPA